MSFTVFLGNLPTWVTADDIKQWLAAEELVADGVKVIRNHETQESKGFAFVEAPTADEMAAIIRRFDRAPLKIACSALIPDSPRQGRKAKQRHRQPPHHPPPLRIVSVPRFVQTARSVAAGIASRRLAAPLLPNSRKCSNPGRRAVVCAQASDHLHTCEPKSHRASVYPVKIQSLPIGLRRAIMWHMKYAWLGCFLFLSSLLSAGTQDSEF